MKRFGIFFVLIALVGCGTSSKRASDVAMESRGYLGPWGGKDKPLIVVDAGHGAFDLGSCHGGCEEKDMALSTSLMLKRYLNEKGYRVVMTRNRDLFIPLAERARMANDAKSQLFVSIHYNAAQSTDAEGIEVYYYGKGDPLRIQSSKKLASNVLSNLLRSTNAASRGVKHGNFHVIRETKMPAILVEAGFITSPKERQLIKSQGYRDKIAQAVANGIDQYLSN